MSCRIVRSCARRPGLRNTLHPDERALASTALLAEYRLERVDAVGTGVLAKAEEDHPHGAICHSVTLTRMRLDCERVE